MMQENIVMSVDEFIKQRRQEKALEGLRSDVEYIKADEYAAKIYRSVTTVNIMCREGKIPGAVKSGKFWFIPVEDKIPEEYKKLIEENAMLKEKLRLISAAAVI